jgi:RNA polymerase sigma-70 factor (ECF subfamily)
MAVLDPHRPSLAALSSASATPEANAPGVDLVAIVDDDRAFRLWYERTAPRVFAYLIARCGSEPIAEELLQAVFVEVVRRPFTYDGQRDPVPWLIGIARHHLAKFYRERHRGEGSWHDGIRPIDPLADHHGLQAATVGVDIRTALQSLPALQQAVLIFRFMDGLSVREVADQIGRSVPATESILRRARAQFERAYRGSGHA